MSPNVVFHRKCLGRKLCILTKTHDREILLGSKVAGVGWLSCTAAESLRAFVERVVANFRDKNIVFYDCGKTGNLWLSKDLHTHRHVPSNTLLDF